MSELLTSQKITTQMKQSQYEATVIEFVQNTNGCFIAAVILPFLVTLQSRAYAACLRFIAGVIPPMPMLGRSLL